jgi:hypothetical protein
MTGYFEAGLVGAGMGLGTSEGIGLVGVSIEGGFFL